MLKALTKAGMTQGAVAAYMGTRSVIEGAGRHAPVPAALKKYAAAAVCELQVKLVPNEYLA
jgi:hypothetical protein